MINRKSLLVIDPHGILRRIYCPFRVKDHKGKILQVDEITLGNDGLLYFQVGGTFKKYSCYWII